MNLYFMRHGIAVDRADSGAGSGDRERPLTPKGIKRMQKADKRPCGAVTLIRPHPHQSSGARAADGKHSGADATLENQLAEIEQLCPDQLVKDLISGLVAYSGAKNILLVGHEPLLSSTVSYLLSGKAGAEIQFKKGGLCCLVVDGCRPKRARFSTGR